MPANVSFHHTNYQNLYISCIRELYLFFFINEWYNTFYTVSLQQCLIEFTLPSHFHIQSIPLQSSKRNLCTYKNRDEIKPY